MNIAVESVVANGPQLAAIWLLLLVLAAGSLAALADRGGLLGPGRLAAWVGARAQRRRDDRAWRVAQAADAARYTEEIAVAAQRATVTVQRRREQWHDAQQLVDTAAGAYQQAGERVLHACRAAAYGAPAIGLTPAHYADRERYLHTAAVQAHRRGHLSTPQLRDALAHRGGWDPRLHPAEQDVALTRATRRHLHHRYQLAVAAERAAWHDAGIAVIAARTLRSEAHAALATTRPARSSAARRHLNPLTRLNTALGVPLHP
jgi:hypothetical protein